VTRLIKKGGRWNRIRFLHIPKTAGTTFRSVLDRQYRSNEIFAFTGDVPADVGRFNALPEEERRAFRLFIGHGPIVSGISEADDAEIITLLRDPISRVKSFCNHVAQGKSAYLLDEFPPDRFDLDRFLESGNTELSNLQTKMLINRADSGSWDRIEPHHLTTAGDMALGALFNRLSLYGIQERFDESLVLFSSRFGWKTPLYRPLNEGRSGRGLVFEERHLARIAELNAIDIAVYRRASEQFSDILKSGGCTAEIPVPKLGDLPSFPLHEMDVVPQSACVN
jgi:hypothetical protein